MSSIACLDCVELTIDAFNYIKRVREADDLFRKSLSESELTHLDVEMQPRIGPAEDNSLTNSPSAETMDISIIDPDHDECGSLLDLEDIHAEYLDNEPEVKSDRLIGLLIESVHCIGEEKWHKLKLDPDFIEVFEMNDAQLETSDDEDFDSKSEQIVRCCSRKCNLIFNTREELVKHGSLMHVSNQSTIDEPNSFECVICYQRFETRRNLMGHLRRLIRDYRCPLCNLYFDAPRDKLAHMNEKHEGMSRSIKNYRLEDQPTKICCGCESTFETMEELFQHGSDHHQTQHEPNGRNNRCNICYKYFKSKASLRNHQTLVYKPKSFSCDICEKAFECPSKLANHKTIHRTERNFACSVCEGKFKAAADLRGHQRIHQEKTFVCNICEARFHKLAHLKSHLKTHDDSKFDYSCSQCEKKFREKSNWKNHLRVHTQEKPYQCEFCPDKFRYAVDRKRHEMKHTGNYPHACEGCSKTFARSTQLQTHMRKCKKQ